LLLLNWRGVSSVVPYLLVGVFLWFCLHHGGIHTTIAGVAVGLAIPMQGKKEGHVPLDDFMHRIHPWISFGVLPLFAFVSSGISLEGIEAGDVFTPMPLGIALGLFFGKQVGIFGITWLLAKLRLVGKPPGVSWMQIYGISIIAGIGFTMSLFIGLLAFPSSEMQDFVKIGVIGGSLLSTVWGFIVLRFLAR
jgi:NhaA family Na+:H+ antiporter